MIDTDNIRCTGSLKPGNFGLPFIHIVLCCFKNFIYVYISADIRLAAHGGLQVAIMTMPHASSSKRNGILGGRFRCIELDRKSTRLNSSHVAISYAVFCLKKKKPNSIIRPSTFKSEQNRTTSSYLA